MPNSVSSLAPHAREVDALLAEGVSNRQIAAQFGVGETTVRRYKPRGGIGEPAPVADLSHAAEDGGEIPVIVRDYRHLESLHVYALSDVHKGSPRHQTERWREWVGYLTRTPATSA